MLTYLLAGLTALVYSMGMIGVGVYNCHCNHNQQITWLTKDDCSCNHEHRHGEETDDHCCDVQYKVLQVDQNITQQLVCFNHYTVIDFVFLPASMLSLPERTLSLCSNHGPPPLPTCSTPDIYTLAQLRL